jgi:hypothetical protein
MAYRNPSIVLQTKLGLPEESRAVYALEVMVAGMIDPGHEIAWRGFEGLQR